MGELSTFAGFAGWDDAGSWSAEGSWSRLQMGWVFPTEERPNRFHIAMEKAHLVGWFRQTWPFFQDMWDYQRVSNPKQIAPDKTTRILKINRWTFVDMGMSGMCKMFLHPNRQIDYLFGSKMVQATSIKMGFECQETWFGSNSKLPPSLDTAHECLLFFGLSWNSQTLVIELDSAEILVNICTPEMQCSSVKFEAGCFGIGHHFCDPT